jgi:hypothetical protein
VHKTGQKADMYEKCISGLSKAKKGIAGRFGYGIAKTLGITFVLHVCLNTQVLSATMLLSTENLVVQ